MISQAVDATLGVGLGIIFLYSALVKLRSPKAFTLQVLEYRVLPTSAGHLVARLLPPSEACVALLLMSGAAPRSTAAATMVLMASFIGAITVNLARGRRIPCGCFGGRERREIGWALVAQDSLLLIATGVLLWRADSWMGFADWSPLHQTDVAPGIAIALGILIAGTAGLSRQSFSGRHGPVQRPGRLQSLETESQGK